LTTTVVGVPDGVLLPWAPSVTVTVTISVTMSQAMAFLWRFMWTGDATARAAPSRARKEEERMLALLMLMLVGVVCFVLTFFEKVDAREGLCCLESGGIEPAALL
jgi:hypothetical protein